MLARRQLEHGDCLSHRTLRLRQTTQLRNFGALADANDGPLADVDKVALFSGPEAEVANDTASADTCDILQSNQ